MLHYIRIIEKTLHLFLKEFWQFNLQLIPDVFRFIRTDDIALLAICLFNQQCPLVIIYFEFELFIKQIINFLFPVPSF